MADAYGQRSGSEVAPQKERQIDDRMLVVDELPHQEKAQPDHRHYREGNDCAR